MPRLVKIKIALFIAIFLGLLADSLYLARSIQNAARFEFLVLPTGEISSLQREDWLQSSLGLRPHDMISWVDGKPFEVTRIRTWLLNAKPDQRLALKVHRGKQTFETSTHLRRYSRNDILILLGIPLFLAFIFVAFAVGISVSREARQRSRQAAEVFSFMCFSAALFFLSLLRVTSLSQLFLFSVLPVLMGVLAMHLLLVYPKLKGRKWVRRSILGIVYSFAGFIALGEFIPSIEVLTRSITTPFTGLCLLIGFVSLCSTLLTSRDFWARRRARLLAFVMTVGFIVVVSVFSATVFEGLRVSIERLLALSLVLPSAVAAIFLKENVFNLERLFRRGVHQLLLLVVASTFALLIGLGWNEWAPDSERDWLLWVAISIVAIMVARPLSQKVEDLVHQFIRTRVRYPDVNDLFERSKSLSDFLRSISLHFATHLNMKNIHFDFFLDPMKPWKAGNDQKWDFKGEFLIRVFDRDLQWQYRSTLYRGDEAIGEIKFDGGDALAFDPYSSREWVNTTRDIARCIEILCLREFISVQQSFLAVGRMQSLIAHQMKNPLAIIKVCAGLLTNHIKGNDEAEEVIRTIQDEVSRVSSAVQSVFEHSSHVEAQERVHLGAVLSQLKENVLARFPSRELEVSYWTDDKKDEGSMIYGIWIEKEGLRQALSNLVVNAYEAGSSWVGIEVRLTKTDFSILVRDRGPGLDSKKDLFKPFVTTKAHGTGLGLAHVKAFLDRNSGQIRVETKKGEGTSFALEFSRKLVFNEMRPS